MCVVEYKSFHDVYLNLFARMQSYFFLPYLGMGCADSHILETSGLPVFQSVLGAGDHSPMALCSSGSVAVMKLHLRVRGKG